MKQKKVKSLSALQQLSILSVISVALSSCISLQDCFEQLRASATCKKERKGFKRALYMQGIDAKLAIPCSGLFSPEVVRIITAPRDNDIYMGVKAAMQFLTVQVQAEANA
jgi:hypothetical protein